MRPASSSRALSSVAQPLRCASIRFASSSNSVEANSSSSEWQPAVAPGASAAYDAAVEYIRQDQRRIQAEMEKLRARTNPTGYTRQQLEALEVESLVNDPATRHRFRTTKGKGHMDEPVMRHLAERRWRQAGGLDLLMGRLHQIKIIPDLLPEIAPTNPLTIAIPQGKVEPGLVIEAFTMEKPPTITFQPFRHPSVPSESSPHPEALYSLLVINIDEPNAETHKYTQRLHYLKSNIALSVASSEVSLMDESTPGATIVDWEPPAPADGSGKLRYVWVLVRQKSNTELAPPPREDFDLREWLLENRLTEASVDGITLVRSTYTKVSREHIDNIWRTHRGRTTAAPVYKKAPKEERYMKPRSSLQQRVIGLRQRAWERSLAEYENAGLAGGLEEVSEGLQEDARVASKDSGRDFEEGDYEGEFEEVTEQFIEEDDSSDHRKA